MSPASNCQCLDRFLRKKPNSCLLLHYPPLPTCFHHVTTLTSSVETVLQAHALPVIHLVSHALLILGISWTVAEPCHVLRKRIISFVIWHWSQSLCFSLLLHNNVTKQACISCINTLLQDKTNSTNHPYRQTPGISLRKTGGTYRCFVKALSRGEVYFTGHIPQVTSTSRCVPDI